MQFGCIGSALKVSKKANVNPRQAGVGSYSGGVVRIIGAAALWGAGYPLWKILSERITALSLTAVSFVVAALLMIPLFRLRPKMLWREFRQNAFFLVLLGLSGGVLGTGLIFYSLSLIDSGVASLLEKLQPVFAVLAARLFLSEQVSNRRAPFMLLALLFSILIAIPDPLSFDYSSAQTVGILAAIASAMF